jgi:hypothetical protein
MLQILVEDAPGEKHRRKSTPHRPVPVLIYVGDKRDCTILSSVLGGGIATFALICFVCIYFFPDEK